MAAGARRLGLPMDYRPSTQYQRVQHDVAIFYGLANGLRRVFDDYRDGHKAIYIDLGYWGRRKRTRYDGYHKLVLNNRHPTAYFQRRQHGPERFAQFGLQIQPWREAGKHILVIGMSAKAAAADGRPAESWESATINELRLITDRPIVYRPKPNWLEARPIPGSTFGKGQTLEEALRDCHAVVAHHSNAAVEALIAGVPCICPSGAASVLSGHELSQIETPPMPDGREQWAWDLAHTQYSIEEMQDGTALRYLMNEGLI